MAPVHHDELTAVGLFRQTTWHEVGHYLGPDTQRSGRTFEDALAEDAAVIEELKSELLSTFACLWLERAGAYTQDEVRAVAAADVLGGLRPVRPLRSQPYPTLWVMRLNHGLESGYLQLRARWRPHRARPPRGHRDVDAPRDAGHPGRRNARRFERLHRALLGMGRTARTHRRSPSRCRAAPICPAEICRPRRRLRPSDELTSGVRGRRGRPRKRLPLVGRKRR